MKTVRSDAGHLYRTDFYCAGSYYARAFVGPYMHCFDSAASELPLKYTFSAGNRWYILGYPIIGRLGHPGFDLDRAMCNGGRC